MFNRKTVVTALIGVAMLTGCVQANAQRGISSTPNRINKVLIVLNSHDRLGNTGKKTGFYLDKAAHPRAVFTQAGHTVDFVSSTGATALIDPKSLKLDDPTNCQFVENSTVMVAVNDTLAPQAVNPTEYRAILFAGRHGAMWDFPNQLGLAQLTAAIYEQGGVVAAVCNGPDALVNVRLANGAYLLAGKAVAASTNQRLRRKRTEYEQPLFLALLTPHGAGNLPLMRLNGARNILRLLIFKRMSWLAIN